MDEQQLRRVIREAAREGPLKPRLLLLFDLFVQRVRPRATNVS